MPTATRSNQRTGWYSERSEFGCLCSQQILNILNHS